MHRLERPWNGAFRCLLPAVLLLCACNGRRSPEDGPPPFAPQDALATFEIADGFRIELVAAEPLIADPVAMEVDENGRIYVVEMPGYPLDVSGTGRVRLLGDRDGDGLPDHSTVFAEGLTMPTGILRWKNGVLVTDPPNVLYLEDTDGDDRADVRKVVLTGFALSNPQHNFNNPRYGLDNWIYLANGGTVWWTERYAEQFGDRGGEVYFPDRPDGPHLGRNGFDRNVRFRPDTYALETMSGDSQFGQTFDAWGHHFLVENAHHHYHEVIAARYFRRNPDLATRRATHSTSDHGDAAEVFPVTVSPEHQLLTDRGVFTSACGITYYLGGAFPAAFDHATFVAEPVHNLVHVDAVSDAGASFTASRMFEGREFLASTDGWFRPVNFYVGPDGALYVVDYYREIVEHPEWMDDATVQSGRLYEGSDRGRIYRVVPEGAPPLSWTDRLSLGRADAATLVDSLESRNGWWRMNAQRLLLDRREEAAAASLERLVRESPVPEARVHALWTLDGLGRLEPSLVEQALQDEAPGVRENAIRLAERYLPQAPSLTAPLLAMERDPDPKVRFQLLCTLGDLDTERVREVRRRLLLHDIEDDWTQIAALLALPGDRPHLFETTVAGLADRETPGRAAFVRRVATVTGAGEDDQAIRRVIEATAGGQAAPGSDWWRAAGLAGLAEGLERRKDPLPRPAAEQRRLLQAFFDADAPAVRRAALDVLEAVGLPEGPDRAAALQQAAALAADRAADPDRRADAVRLLAAAAPQDHVDLLEQAVDPQEPAPVQQAALRALRRVPGAEVGAYLLARWNTLTPDIRAAAVDVFMTEDRMPLLLDAVENQVVQPSTIGWERRVVLMRDTEGAVRDRARTLLNVEDAARDVVLERYREALSRPGDAGRGEQVFARICAACHRAGTTAGAPFGPDLATVRHWPKQALLAKILNPERSVADGYEFWSVELKSSRTLTGVIVDETPTSITVRNQAEEQTIPRTDILSIAAAGSTAMPTGLEAQIDEQEMADLLAFLKATDSPRAAGR